MFKVLIVDDAAFMRTTLKCMLEKHDFKIIGEAINGAEAVQKAKELKPDIITMDITMPELDGIAATTAIVQDNPSIKICIISAVGQESKVKEAILAGAKYFVVKPFKEEHVIKTLQSMIST